MFLAFQLGSPALSKWLCGGKDLLSLFSKVSICQEVALLLRTADDKSSARSSASGDGGKQRAGERGSSLAAACCQVCSSEHPNPELKPYLLSSCGVFSVTSAL